MHQIHTYRIFWALLCLIFILTSTSARALDVQDIRFGQHPEKIRMVLDISDVVDFRAFVLSSPYRMVIDLPTFEWQAGQVVRPKQAMMSDIRQGKLSPGISRIVFDLKQPITIQSAFLLPKQGEKENRIVLDYVAANTADFQAHKEIIHGTLKVDNYQNASAISNEVPRPPKNTSRPITTANKKPLIIIDPGHGGTDPGTIGYNKIYEKNIVLALAKELKKRLLRSGKYQVLLTRENDVFIRLKNRVKFAHEHEGDLFISLHADSIHKPDVNGTSIYTLSKKASDAQTAKLAEKENQADLMAGVNFNIEDEQVAFILGDFLINDTINQSKFLANTIVSKLKSHNINILQNPHRYAGFAVLKSPDIPSILIEAGFVSNKKDAHLLSQPSHRQKIAAAIHSGVDAYFNNVHKNENN